LTPVATSLEPALRPPASEALRSIVFLALALLAILVLLPAALTAAT
jgi:hypothetical protein